MVFNGRLNNIIKYNNVYLKDKIYHRFDKMFNINYYF